MSISLDKRKKFYKDRLTDTLNCLLTQVDDIIDRSLEKPTFSVSISIDIEPEEAITYAIQYNCIAVPFEIDKVDKNGRK